MSLGKDFGELRQCFLGSVFFISREEHDMFALAGFAFVFNPIFGVKNGERQGGGGEGGNQFVHNAFGSRRVIANQRRIGKAACSFEDIYFSQRFEGGAGMEWPQTKLISVSFAPFEPETNSQPKPASPRSLSVRFASRECLLFRS
jgi:hypothetical protein